MATQQVVPVTCPNCQTPFTAPIYSIIDGQDPMLKSALLQGRLNVTQCPQCGFTDMLNAPLLYYDQEKELAFVLAPNSLQLKGSDQEKVIGNLTNTLINSLPAEERKFYLFNPKQFLTMESLVKAVLEADGITEEMLKAQEAKVKLIQEFLEQSDEASLKEKIKERESELDLEFFEILTASVQAAQMAGDMTNFQALLGLRRDEEARTAFADSLRVLLNSQTRPIGLDALVGMAHVKARAGQLEEALELLSLVKTHPSSYYESKEKARELWEELAAELPAELIAQAEARGQEMDLWQTAESLLSEGSER